MGAKQQGACRAAGSAVYHAVASAHPPLPPEMHETSCGWMLGLARHTARFGTPPTHIKVRGGNGLLGAVAPCKKCWRPEDEVAVAPEAEGAG